MLDIYSLTLKKREKVPCALSQTFSEERIRSSEVKCLVDSARPTLVVQERRALMW